MRNPQTKAERPLTGGTLFSGIGSPEVSAPWVADPRYVARLADRTAPAIVSQECADPGNPLRAEPLAGVDPL